MTNKFISLLVCILLSLAAPGQAQQLSDQQILASIDKVPPPPKTISDLIKILDASSPDIETTKRNQEIVKAQPPQGTNREQLWNFYKAKVKALEELGYTRQMMEDCKKEIEYADASDPNIINDAYMSCIQADFNDGNPLAAVDKIKLALSKLPSTGWLGWQLTYNMLLVNAYRSLGDLDAAQNAIREVDGILTVLRRGPSWSEYGDHWTIQAERARGEFQMVAGRAVAAELSFARALRAVDTKLSAIESGLYKGSTRRVHDKNRSVQSKAIVLWRMGSALFAQRKLSEAEYYFRLSLRTFLSVGSRNTAQVAGVLGNLANCVAEQGRVEEGLLLARYALQVTEESGIAPTSFAAINTRRGLAAALVHASKYKEALEQFNLIRKTIDGDALIREKLKRINDLDEVIARVYAGDSSFAERIARDMHQAYLKLDGAKHPRTAWTEAFLGVSLQVQGKSGEAQKAFHSSVPILIDQARNDSENQTISLKAQKRFNMAIESYIETLFADAKRNPAEAKNQIATAFQLADMARGSAVQRALTQSTARSNIKDKRLEQLARKEQDLQRRINSLNELLAALSAAPPERQLPAVQAKMKSDIESLKEERNSVKKEIENRFPEYFDLVEPKPITVARTAKILKPNEVLVTWYFGDRKSYVWAIHSTGLDGFAELPLTKADVSRDVEQLRKALDPGVGTVDEIPPFDTALAHRFYNALIKPVESSLSQKDLLISIPHAALGQLPISTFVTEPVKQPGKGAAAFTGYQNAPWLIRKIAISQLPSVNALAALRSNQEQVGKTQTFVAFADPFFSTEQARQASRTQTTQLATRGLPLRLRSAPKTSKVSSAELALLPALPDTGIEVREIGRVLGAKDSDIYLHEQASVKKVMETDFSRKSIVMFSTHGLVPGELDGLTQPALALSSPDVTGEKDSDGLLTMDKILELKLNADWVVLSACNTASGDGNSEAVSGLGRAFFYAGARALLVSNWPVDTVASRQLMTDLFSRQSVSPAISKPEALRRSMLELADKGGQRNAKTNALEYAYAHPLFWAPFVVVGD